MRASEESDSLATSAGAPTGGGFARAWERRWGEPLHETTGGATLPLFLAVWALLLLPALPFERPALEGVSLDRSHAQIVAYCVANALQLGQDYAFTFGPLRWLYDNIGRVYQPGLFWVQAPLALLLFGYAAWAVTRAAFRLTGLKRLLFIALAGTVAVTRDLPLLAMVVVARDLIAHPRIPAWRVAGAMAFFAAMAFVKFTNLALAACFIVLIATSAAAGERPVRRIAVPPLAFAASWLVIWLALLQNPLNIPAYLRTAAEIAAGYSEGMAAVTQPAWMAVAGGALLAAWLVAEAIGLLEPQRPVVRQLCLLAVSALTAFFAWKNGIVRFDAPHAAMLFYAAALFPWLSWPAGRAGGVAATQRVLLGLVIAAGAWLWFDATGAGPAGAVARWSRDLAESAAFFVEVPARRDAARAVAERESEALALPETRAAIGGHGVDLLTANRQGVLLANGFRYDPRVVIQSYSAYTPSLLALNAAHFAGAGRPPYVLLRLNAIDNRYQPMEDALALLAVLRHYRETGSEQGYHLMQRVDAWAPVDAHASDDAPPMRSLLEREAGFWDPIDLSPYAGQRLAMAVEINETVRGRLQRALLRAPLLSLVITRADGQTREHRLVPGMARSGFLLQPYVATAPDLFLYAEPPGAGPALGRDVAEVRIQPAFDASAAYGCYETPFRVRILAVDTAGWPRSAFMRDLRRAVEDRATDNGAATPGGLVESLRVRDGHIHARGWAADRAARTRMDAVAAVVLAPGEPPALWAVDFVEIPRPDVMGKDAPLHERNAGWSIVTPEPPAGARLRFYAWDAGTRTLHPLRSAPAE